MITDLQDIKSSSNWDQNHSSHHHKAHGIHHTFTTELSSTTKKKGKQSQKRVGSTNKQNRPSNWAAPHTARDRIRRALAHSPHPPISRATLTTRVCLHLRDSAPPTVWLLRNSRHADSNWYSPCFLHCIFIFILFYVWLNRLLRVKINPKCYSITVLFLEPDGNITRDFTSLSDFHS